MYVYPHNAKRYINEARLVIARIQGARDGDDLQRALIHLLESTKHSTIQLQTDFRSKLSGFDEWWSLQVAKLKMDSLCRFFYGLRNRVVKGGENVLANNFSIAGPFELSGPCQIGPDGVLLKVRKGDSYEWIHKKDIPGMRIDAWKFSEYPTGYSEKEESLLLCQKYVDILDGVVDDFIIKFGRDA